MVKFQGILKKNHLLEIYATLIKNFTIYLNLKVTQQNLHGSFGDGWARKNGL